MGICCSISKAQDDSKANQTNSDNMATTTTAGSGTPPVVAGGGGGAIHKVIHRLLDLGINLLAIDFDQTILDIHTGGRWNDTLEELLPHVRPEFAQLIPAALDNNIHVAIVTFSSQIHLVRGVLEYICSLAAGNINNDNADIHSTQYAAISRAAQIPIRGGDRSWSYKGGGSREGKQHYIASAVEELESKNPGLEITKNTTVLIDDDSKNIRFAFADHVRGVWLNPDKPHLLLQDLIKLI